MATKIVVEVNKPKPKKILKKEVLSSSKFPGNQPFIKPNKKEKKE